MVTNSSHSQSWGQGGTVSPLHLQACHPYRREAGAEISAALSLAKTAPSRGHGRGSTGRAVGADAVCQSRGPLSHRFPLPPPGPARRTDAEPLSQLCGVSFLPTSPGTRGVCSGQGALHPTHSPSRLVPVPRMLFPDAAGLLGQQEGREGRHAAAVAPRCLLTRRSVLAAAREPVPQEAAVGESILSPPPGKAGADHGLLHPTRNVALLPSLSLGRQVPAGIVLRERRFSEKSLRWGHGRAVSCRV